MVPVNWPKTILISLFPFTGYFVGSWLDRIEDERMSRFRDKSSLYGRILAPGEKPSWP